MVDRHFKYFSSKGDEHETIVDIGSSVEPSVGFELEEEEENSPVLVELDTEFDFDM